MGLARRAGAVTALGLASLLGHGLSIAAAAPKLPRLETEADPVWAQVSRAPDAKGVAVDVRGIVEAPLEDVARVVGDFGNYSTWAPNVKATAIPVGADGVALFDTTVKLPWPLKMVHERVRVERIRALAADLAGDQPAGQKLDQAEVAWRQVSGDMRRDEGRWVLIRRGPQRTEVRYQALFQLRSWVPVFLVRAAEKRNAPWLFSSLRGRVAALRRTT